MKRGFENVENLFTSPTEMKNNIPDIINDNISPCKPVIKFRIPVKEQMRMRNNQCAIANL